MNTKLLALAYLLNKNPESFLKPHFRNELSTYTTERLFEIMAEIDKNPTFKPESIFDIITERGDDTGMQIINYLKKVSCRTYNCTFKQKLCTALLQRNDYLFQELEPLFFSKDVQGAGSILGISFLDNKELVLQKLASCPVEKLAEISGVSGIFRDVSEMAKKAAEEKLPEVSTDVLLRLLHKRTNINIGKELENRSRELMHIVSQNSL